MNRGEKVEVACTDFSSRGLVVKRTWEAGAVVERAEFAEGGRLEAGGNDPAEAEVKGDSRERGGSDCGPGGGRAVGSREGLASVRGDGPFLV